MTREDKLKKCTEQLSKIAGRAITQEQTKMVRDIFIDLHKESPEFRFTFDQVNKNDPNL